MCSFHKITNGCALPLWATILATFTYLLYPRHIALLKVVHQPVQNCTNIHQTAPTYATPYRTVSNWTNMPQITPNYTNLNKPAYASNCTKHQTATTCTKLHQTTPTCTKLQQAAPNCTNYTKLYLHQLPQPALNCINIPQTTTASTKVHRIAPNYISLHHTTPTRTKLHKPAPSNAIVTTSNYTHYIKLH